MSFLEHLDELRRRLFRCALAYLAVFAAAWAFRAPLLSFLLRPVREHIVGAGDIVFLHVTEPFFIYMKASAVAAVFACTPWFLYQLWGFVAPGLYRRERLLVVPFLLFGTLFFVGGGAFGYYVAVPRAAAWLLDVGRDFRAALTLSSAFQFVSWMVLAMGAVFELPLVIFFLARMGIVTPGFLMRHFRFAVLAMAVIAAVITPSGDMLTMTIFAAPMVGLYLLGVAVAWLFGRRDGA
jgi:sec-independent protein translocase protein TatC